MSVYRGRTIVVTGASSGIGRALCLALASQGPNLLLAGRDKAALDEAAVACRERGGDARISITDVSSEAACRDLIGLAMSCFGRLDVLVVNAGITMWSALEDVSDLSIYDRLMQVNYLGAVYATFHALPHLKESRGQIVAVSSIAGLTGVPTRTGYAATKHAMFGFFESLRIELHGSGVSVTMVAPDFVVTNIHRRALGADGQPLGDTPLKESKVMTAAECAALIVPAMERRQRLLVTSPRGRLGRWLKLVAPRMIDRIAAKAIRERH